MIPTRSWVFTLITERGMPDHIVRHSMRVRLVAVAIGQAMRRAGKGIDLALIDRSALLHDICKADSIAHGGDHALMGQLLLESLGYPQVGDIVGQHIRLRSMEMNEAMVVNYADKRVMHDQVVSLEKRFSDLIDRYSNGGKNTERLLQHFAHVREIEETVLKASGVEPEWLETLNLVPGDHPLDGGDGLGGEDGPVEEQHHHVDLERIDHDEPVEVDE
jgi:uncharacterized protein